MSKKKEEKARSIFILWCTIIFIAGVIVGNIFPVGFAIKGDANVEMVNKKLEEFKRVEAICGKGNVISNCFNDFAGLVKILPVIDGAGLGQ